ncbi:hypothetical protein BDP27DRAFT_1391284 [Rhodocollybia butyracea]|uniref:Uncharacterized protein n=1 Tax=Rhodocollybia butyracea TaxID=206335 RepID=A0A9P5Q166_9AGAR|nr:hypothetical protein BDP27DRAFT_1391284 [Rhodocollybia butyracea]
MSLDRLSLMIAWIFGNLTTCVRIGTRRLALEVLKIRSWSGDNILGGNAKDSRIPWTLYASVRRFTASSRDPHKQRHAGQCQVVPHSTWPAPMPTNNSISGNDCKALGK